MGCKVLSWIREGLTGRREVRSGIVQDCSQGKGKMRHQELRLQRGEAKKVLGKFDELYDFIRNSRLHYKINENFGCTVITVGRNFHR